MVRVMTGVGVEPCVAMTSEVTLSGAISGVSGLEGKLRYAHSSPRIKVVVLPRDNLAEAEELVHKYGLNSIRLAAIKSSASSSWAPWAGWAVRCCCGVGLGHANPLAHGRDVRALASKQAST